MATPPTVNPFNFYAGLDGLPLQNGSIYFGEPFQDPELTPIAAYWDDANTQPAAQPIRTLGGYPARNGSPAQVFVGPQYSMRVRDSQGRVVFYAPNVTAVDLGAGGLDVIVASAGQTIVTLTNATYTPGANALDVFLNGIRQISGQDYLETSSSSITLTSALAAGDQIIAFARTTFGLTQAVLSDWLYQTFDGTGAQTDFTLTRNPAALANLDVSLSGNVLTAGTDYTLSGTTLTLTVAPPIGVGNLFVRYGRSLPQDALRGELANASAVGEGDAMIAYKRTIIASASSTLHAWHEKQPYNMAIEGGCVGDDSTNNTAAIAAVLIAFALLPAEGRPALYWPHGVHKADYFNMPSDIVMFGDGVGSVLKQTIGNGRGFIKSADTTNGSHRITLRTLCIDGDKANQPTTSAGYLSHGIDIDGPCEDWLLDRIKVMDTMGHGTHIRGGGPTSTATCTNGTRFLGCWYKDTGYYDVGAVNGRECVYANQAQNLIITDCLMEGSGRQTIALEGSTSSSAIASRRTVIANNILRNAQAGAGIDDEANAGGDHIFANNVIYNMTGAGIRTVGDTGRKMLTNNIIFNVTSRGIDAESEAGFAGASLHITHNIIDTTGTDAIKAVGGQGTLIQGNTIISAGTIAIYLRNQVATETGGRIVDNWVNGSGQEGIVLDRSSISPHVCGNTVVNAGSAAFPSAAISVRSNATFIESPLITGNTAIETRGTPYTTYAFSFSSLNKPSVSGNVVHGTTATGDAQFTTTACTNVILGANNWDWARVSINASTTFKAGYSGQAALYAIAWDADAAPTLTISSNVITPVTRRAFVGAGLIKTITAPIAVGGGTITLIPTAAFTTDATANVAIASTAVIGRAMHMTYDSGTTKWYPSY